MHTTMYMHEYMGGAIFLGTVLGGQVKKLDLSGEESKIVNASRWATFHPHTTNNEWFLIDIQVNKNEE